MKKLFSLLLVIAMVASFMVFGVSAAGTTVSASSATAKTGDTVSITVSISGNPGFVSGGVSLDYDSSKLELVSVSKGLFNGNVSGTYVNHASVDAVEGDSALFTVTFKVLAESGTVTVTPVVKELCDYNFANIACGVSAGTITIEKPACEHDYKGTQTKAPTCTEAGEMTYTCSKCQDSYTESVKANGHSFGEWTVIKAATCTEDGSKTRKCSACSDTETETIKAEGHKEVKVPGKDATCTETGLTEGSKCSVCGTVIKAQTEIAVKDHTYDWVVDRKPTATQTGLKHQECSVCGHKANEGTVIPVVEGLDDVPQTNDITPHIALAVIAVIAVFAAVAFTFKRKTAK